MPPTKGIIQGIHYNQEIPANIDKNSNIKVLTSLEYELPVIGHKRKSWRHKEVRHSSSSLEV